jgi:16S rRNA processing protein RimM
VARNAAGDRRLVLTGRSGAPPHVVLTFEGVSLRDHAAELTGAALLASPEVLPPIEEEATFYVRDLIGCAVEVDGAVVGVVTDVVPGAANDALEVERDGVRTLIPFISEAVRDLDVPGRRIGVRESFLLFGER